MSMFEFFRNGQHVSPLWRDCDQQFWNGVTAIGYAASLSGASSNLVQAGHWDEIYTDGHYELYEIKDISGLCLETNRAWRGG